MYKLMLDPPPMIKFLDLRTCSVRIKGCHALKWGTCSYSNTEQQYTIVARQRTSVRFKLAVRTMRGDTGAGGLYGGPEGHSKVDPFLSQVGSRKLAL